VSWYDDAWTHRLPVSVVPDPGNTDDVSIVLQIDDEEFWSKIQGDADDVLITGANGTTVISRLLTGLVYATRTLQIDIDAVTKVADVTNILWLYFGNAAAIAPTPGGAVAGAIAGKLDRSTAAARVIKAYPQRAGDTRPRDILTKEAAEAIYVFVDFTDLLQRRPYLYEGRDFLEEPATVTYTCSTAGAAQAAMIDTSLTRWVEAGGRRYAKILLKAGTSATNYTVAVTVVTSEAQTLVARFRLFVRDTAET